MIIDNGKRAGRQPSLIAVVVDRRTFFLAVFDGGWGQNSSGAAQVDSPRKIFMKRWPLAKFLHSPTLAKFL